MRVLLVDDHRLFREGLCALLRGRDKLEIVGQAANAREAYVLVRRLHPNLVVLELLLSGVDGVTAAQEIRRLEPACRILVVTACKNRRQLQMAWLAGIDGCLAKDESADVLFAAIASLKAGRRYVAPSLRRTGAALHPINDRRRNADNPMETLSLRETQVFDLVVRGFTTKAVAQELCISAKTVETHRAHINEKLNVHSSADLVRFALQNGLLPPQCRLAD